MEKTICVYSSSSCAIDPVFFEAAEELGRKIAENKDTLLFGGGMTGLMGAVARAVKEKEGNIIGVIPEALNVEGVVYAYCNELVVTSGMRERKGIMDTRSDAFIALPGGYGTLEELLEIITLKQLKYHNKAIVLLNTAGFYSKLLEQFEDIIRMKFAKEECRELYFVTSSVAEAVTYIDTYIPPVFEDKWLTNVEKE